MWLVSWKEITCDINRLCVGEIQTDWYESQPEGQTVVPACKITLLRVIPTMTCWVGVARLGLSSSFIPWTGSRKTSNEVEKVRWKRPNRSQQMHFKSSKPGILFFRIFAWSCRVLCATQDSTCQKCSSKQVTTICQNMSVYHLAETNMPKHATTNMPNHVRIPPVKNK